MQPDVNEIEKLVKRLDNSGLAEYVRLSRNTGKILWLNFLASACLVAPFTFTFQSCRFQCIFIC